MLCISELIIGMGYWLGEPIMLLQQFPKGFCP